MCWDNESCRLYTLWLVDQTVWIQERKIHYLESDISYINKYFHPGLSVPLYNTPLVIDFYKKSTTQTVNEMFSSAPKFYQVPSTLQFYQNPIYQKQAWT